MKDIRIALALPFLAACAACTPPASRNTQEAAPVAATQRDTQAPAPVAVATPEEAPAMSSPSKPPAPVSASRPAASVEGTRDMPRLEPTLPGERVPGSLIAIPGQVRAGESLSGQVPVGSRVTIDGKSVNVDARGAFRHPVPAGASGTLTVRVEHPVDGAPLTQRVRVVSP